MPLNLSSLEGLDRISHMEQFLGTTPDQTPIAFGLKSWGGYPSRLTNSALTSQTIYAMSVPLAVGQSISNAVLGIATAASGTAPTGFFVGLCNSAGTMLAQSANLNSNALLSAAVAYVELPFSTQYTVTANGLYYVLVLQNGAFSVTQPAFTQHGGTTGVTIKGNILYGLAGTAQTALPANGAAVTLAASGSPIDFWRGVS